jgi:hypothetical protein
MLGAQWQLCFYPCCSLVLVLPFDELTEIKIALVSMKDGLDLGTTTGRLVARIMASVAAYEVEVLTEKQRTGIEAARDPKTGKCDGALAGDQIIVL